MAVKIIIPSTWYDLMKFVMRHSATSGLSSVSHFQVYSFSQPCIKFQIRHILLFLRHVSTEVEMEEGSIDTWRFLNALAYLDLNLSVA